MARNQARDEHYMTRWICLFPHTMRHGRKAWHRARRGWFQIRNFVKDLRQASELRFKLENLGGIASEGDCVGGFLGIRQKIARTFRRSAG